MGRSVFRSRAWLGVACALLAIMLVTGCATLAERERQGKLQKSVEHYANHLRWGRYNEAAGFIAPRTENPPHAIDTSPLKEIRVTAYQLGMGEFSKDEKEASITVLFTYYQTNSGRLETIADLQHWWYEEKLARWFKDGDLPDFWQQRSDAR